MHALCLVVGIEDVKDLNERMEKFGEVGMEIRKHTGFWKRHTQDGARLPSAESKSGILRRFGACKIPICFCL